MNDRMALRKDLNLTQTAAAARAGVSLATWRRWEADPDSVATDTAGACERVLRAHPLHRSETARDAIELAWNGDNRITPRQAFALAVVLGLWADELRAWIESPADEPLHDVGPFAVFDHRVMFYVGENLAFAAATRDRCDAVAREIESGTLPFLRPGRFIDEVLMGAALPTAEAYLNEMPELFEDIRPRIGDELDEMGDDDWDVLSDWFDDEAFAADWEVPLGLPALPVLLAERHPFTWFDEEGEAPSYSLLRNPAAEADDR